MRCSFCDKSLNNKKIGLPLFNHFNNELIKDKNAYQVYECKYCNLIQKKKLDTLHKKLFVKNYQIKRVLPSFKKKTIYEITLKKILKKKKILLDYGSTNYLNAKKFLENNPVIKNKRIYFFDKYLKIKKNIIYNVNSNKIIVLKELRKINFDYILMQNCLMYEKDLKKFLIDVNFLVHRNITIEIFVTSIENPYQFLYGDNYNYFSSFFLKSFFLHKSFMGIEKNNSIVPFSYNFLYTYNSNNKNNFNFTKTKKIYLRNLIIFLQKKKNEVENYFKKYKNKKEIYIFGSRANAFFIFYLIKPFFKKIYLLDEKINFSSEFLKKFNVVTPGNKVLNKQIPVILNYGINNYLFKKKLIKYDFKNFILF